MLKIIPIKVNLNEHALERLVSRQPQFMSYTPPDVEEVINLLNNKHKSGMLLKRKREKISTYDLKVLSLSGIFYLKGDSSSNCTYDALTFKLLKNPFLDRSFESRDVITEYSFKNTNKNRI
jgi:hypothetical protein